RREALPPPPPPSAGPVAWVQMTEHGAEVRVVRPGALCPIARVDGRTLSLRPRATADDRFPLVCSAPLQPGARTVEVVGRNLVAPRPVVRRMVVFADTGCRIKGPLVQACNDPAAWPFAEVARRAAARHPDLVIHIGDYYYRESACPVGDLRCAGSPSGDRWDAWAADFFDPAAPLLQAAPWVFVRGNHESCARGGVGWFRLLDAAPAAKACPAEASAWTVPIGGLNLYVLDSADTVDESAPPARVAAFAGQLSALGSALARQPGWIVVHRPIWGLAPVVRIGPLGPVSVPLNATEQAAVKGRDLSAVALVLSGHIHHFSSFDFAAKRPAQLVVGTGGDIGLPADTPRITRDEVLLDGLTADHAEFDRFGYMVLDRVGDGSDHWRGVFYDAQDRPVVDCRLEGRRLTCAPALRAAR
ncbi:metallophosphoesterase, partial [Caulobacter sp. S45]|uniref:metallophosphoesterase family protein n=1 Tax=Caulobacter sp. S45 TaxID=1641861 RepID=UPI001C2D9DCF